MPKENIVIKIKGLRKKYRLGAIGGSSLREALESWWAKKRGKEDPNLMIGISPQIFGKTFWALNGIDLTVRQGERVGIIGLNGAGKSTLLKILSRITAPTEGEIDIDGQLSSMLEIGMGFHGEMTGRENVYMNGAILGMSREEIKAKMEDIIAFSEIGDFIDTPVKRYSSGMFVKLAFSVVAHLDSEIMVMDEVLAVGDMAFQQKCLAKMREVSEKQDRTILYVSHNMATIRTLCDRCIVLKQGKICFDGNVEDAISVYMGEKQGKLALSADLTEQTIYQEYFDHGLRLQKLLLLDENAPDYNSGETLNMRLFLTAAHVETGLAVRLTLLTSDGFILASAGSGNFDLQTGAQSLKISLPLTGIANGSIKLTLSLGKWTDNGYFRIYALAEQALGIRTRCPDRWWNPVRHGYWNLPGLTVQTDSES